MPAVLRLKDKYGNVYSIPAIRGEKGSSIQAIERTSGDGSSGTIDTYKLTMSTGETFCFNVYNGADGQTHKAGTNILIDGNDMISIDMAERISEEEQRPISASMALQTFQQLTNAVKITTGSYVGDGTYGADAPVSLTFDFIPKFIIVAETNRGNGDFIIWITGCKAMLRKMDAEYSAYVLPATLTNQTLTFYNVSDAVKQFNESDVIYYYFALG